MLVSELYRSVTDMPTIISLEETLWLTEQLMQVRSEHLIAEQILLLSLLQRLELSYTDSGFMELTTQNENRILMFSQWLDQIRQQYQLDIPEVIIDNFALTVKEINNLMNNGPA